MTALVIIIASCLCFMLCALIAGPSKVEGATLFGAGEMEYMFRLLIYPFKFFPLALPAIACWILAAAYEKWHVALHIIAAPALSLIAIVNMYLFVYALVYPDTLEWLMN